MTSRPPTLLAQPSKEWVIPPKPKPGRKPKTDDSAKVDSLRDGDQDRKIMNRAAQRAFRERKQSQLADLHARIQAYEQGEVERNIALQNIGKKLKEENDRLKKENTDLKEELRRLQDRLRSFEGRTPSLGRLEIDTSLDSSSSYPSKKRPRLASDELSSERRMSSRETVASSETAATSSLRSPSSLSPSTRDALSSTPTQTKAFIAESNVTMSNGIMASTVSFGSSSYDAPVAEVSHCGFCSEATACLCREVAETSADATDTFALSPVEQKSPSIMSQLPPYQPPVPIRLRADRSQAVSQAWVLDKKHDVTTSSNLSPVQPSALTTSAATCSGDPSNCAACADDPFGRAFCTALGDSMCSRNPCPGCPNRSSGGTSASYGSTSGQSTSSLPCCGDPELCGGLCGPPQQSTASSSQQTYASSGLSSNDNTTIPADEAWRAIKSHPQAQFADLTLLADVVARRTTCAGPSSESPRSSAAAWPYTRTLVPHSELIEAGRKRRMQVHKDGLREALDMLDRGLYR